MGEAGKDSLNAIEMYCTRGGCRRKAILRFVLFVFFMFVCFCLFVLFF